MTNEMQVSKSDKMKQQEAEMTPLSVSMYVLVGVCTLLFLLLYLLELDTAAMCFMLASVVFFVIALYNTNRNKGMLCILGMACTWYVGCFAAFLYSVPNSQQLSQDARQLLQGIQQSPHGIQQASQEVQQLLQNIQQLLQKTQLLSQIYRTAALFCIVQAIFCIICIVKLCHAKKNPEAYRYFRVWIAYLVLLAASLFIMVFAERWVNHDAMICMFGTLMGLLVFDQGKELIVLEIPQIAAQQDPHNEANEFVSDSCRQPQLKVSPDKNGEPISIRPVTQEIKLKLKKADRKLQIQLSSKRNGRDEGQNSASMSQHVAVSSDDDSGGESVFISIS